MTATTLLSFLDLFISQVVELDSRFFPHMCMCVFLRALFARKLAPRPAEMMMEDLGENIAARLRVKNTPFYLPANVRSGCIGKHCISVRKTPILNSANNCALPRANTRKKTRVFVQEKNAHGSTGDFEI